MTDPKGEKQRRRTELRERRGRLARIGEPDRSRLVGERLIATLSDVVSDGCVVMLYEAIGSEIDVSSVSRWCDANGVSGVAPDPVPGSSQPVAPGAVDVVVVPGLAFTPAGERLGQGGGWYDRFLAATRSSCLLIGVCDDGLLVDEIPTEPHDRAVHVIVTDRQTLEAGAPRV